MARASRETIYAALFTLLKTMVLPSELQFKVTGRKLVSWDDVPLADQPAMFLKQGFQLSSQADNLALTKLTLDAQVWIYFRTEGNTNDQVNYPDQYINQFLDALELLLDPVPGRLQSLGGVCYHCWLEGTIMFDDGLVDNQAVIVAPVKILVGV